MVAVVYTEDLELYAELYRVLRNAGWKVSWKEGKGVALADLGHLPWGQVWVWRTPFGLRAYEPKALRFLTRRDDPKTLPQGLLGRGGFCLSPGEARALAHLGGVEGALEGLNRDQRRFFLKRVRLKFGLPEPLLQALARHQVEVAGLQDHLQRLARPEAEPLLHVPGQEDLQGQRPLEAAPVA